MHGKTLRNWKAKRAGGRITIYGFDAVTNEVEKIVGVDEITPASLVGTEERRVGVFAKRTERVIGAAWATAVDKDGVTHKLLIA